VEQHDLGIDEVRVALAGEGHPVVAVGHEVQAAELVDLDRRQFAFRERGAQRPQALARERSPRAEGLIEVAAAIDRAHDPVDRDRLHPAGRLADRPQAPPDLVEWQQAHRPQSRRTRSFRMRTMAKYAVNKRGVAKARELIESRQYVLDSEWGEVQPRAPDENAFIEAHGWDDYAAWHLGLTEGATEDTKARYAFVYGDFRRLHRSGIIACHYRAAEWRHKEIELAAHELLQLLDERSGLTAD
jgi:hypothetical protein